MAAFGKANSNAKRCTGEEATKKGQAAQGQGQTSPHNEHQGRFHPEQGIGLGVEMGLWLGVMYGRGTTPTFKNVRQFANATSRVEQSLK